MQETHPLNALDAAWAALSDGTGRPVASQCVRTLTYNSGFMHGVLMNVASRRVTFTKTPQRKVSNVSRVDVNGLCVSSTPFHDDIRCAWRCVIHFPVGGGGRVSTSLRQERGRNA